MRLQDTKQVGGNVFRLLGLKRESYFSPYFRGWSAMLRYLPFSKKFKRASKRLEANPLRLFAIALGDSFLIALMIRRRVFHSSTNFRSKLLAANMRCRDRNRHRSLP